MSEFDWIQIRNLSAGQVFEGTGSSKKLAKQACARSALSALYNVSFTPTVAPPPNGSSDAGTPTNGDASVKLVIGNKVVCSGLFILQ